MAPNIDRPATADDMPDEMLIQEAERLNSEDRLLAACELLHQVGDKSLLKPAHEQILHMGKLMAQAKTEMLENPEKSGWKKQSESHG